MLGGPKNRKFLRTKNKIFAFPSVISLLLDVNAVKNGLPCYNSF